MRDNKTIFQVIEGGLSTSPDTLRFQSAWVTDTRLMGVFVMCIHWQGTDPLVQLHQLFYFDCEELGLDRFEYMEGPMNKEFGDMEASFVGGLGGSKKGITQREAAYILRKYVGFNRTHGLPLPEPAPRYLWICETEEHSPVLTHAEETELFGRMCVDTDSPNSLANYYLMRACGGDEEAMEFLSYPAVGDALGSDRSPGNMDVPQTETPNTRRNAGNPFSGLSAGVFYSNKVRKSGPDHDQTSPDDPIGGLQPTDRLVCESTIESGGNYYHIVSHMDVSEDKVLSCERTSSMRLSEMEAYLILNHSEFVTVFDFEGNPDAFVPGITALSRRAMITEEHDGRTFMIYHQNNEHVNKDEYYLYNDLLGMYHIGDNGELLVASPSLESIRRMELDIQFSKVQNMIEPQGSFEFNEPVVMQYLESDFPSFLEFMEAIQDE